MPTDVLPRFDSMLPLPLRDAIAGLERRQAVRAPTGLRFAFADQLAALSASAWDEVTRSRGLMLSRRYLQALESAGTPNVEHRYALGFDGARPVLAMAMQILDVGIDRLRPASKHVIEGLDTDALEQSVRQRVLVCGNLLSAGLDGIAFAEGLDEDLAWRAVGEVLYRVRRAEKLNGHRKEEGQSAKRVERARAGRAGRRVHVDGNDEEEAARGMCESQNSPLGRSSACAGKGVTNTRKTQPARGRLGCAVAGGSRRSGRGWPS